MISLRAETLHDTCWAAQVKLKQDNKHWPRSKDSEEVHHNSQKQVLSQIYFQSLCCVVVLLDDQRFKHTVMNAEHNLKERY